MLSSQNMDDTKDHIEVALKGIDDGPCRSTADGGGQ